MKPMEFNSIPFIHGFCSKSSHPLFSAIVTLYILILLYAPSSFLTIVFSPVLNSTGIVLLSLLRLGANQRLEKESGILDSRANERLEKESTSLEPEVLDSKWLSIDEGNLALYSGLVPESDSVESRFHNQTRVEFEPRTGLALESDRTHVESEPKSCLDLEFNQTHIEFEHDLGSESEYDYHKWELLETTSIESSLVVEEGEPRMEMDPKQVVTTMSFLEWNMRAPLESIYEAYEGEEDDNDKESNENDEVSIDKQAMGCERYPSLSMYYPESETDSSSDGDLEFKWEEEDREELIEISLEDHYGKKRIEFCHAEEDNLIEIDIFPTRN